ncbi:MAG: S23 ribosomal protein [Candidatus Amesbacteria bacterium GW2011_GWA1_46_35]|nr:MAG: S23 ribosomal protein [Candidatus Amesbacteria bacterium GW2011_GWA1_46_35]
MSYFDHHNLIYFQKAKQLTKEVVLLFGKLPQTKTNEILYKQILRAVSSIGANIAEGYGRNNKKEFRQYLGIARGSALETEYWLEIIQETSSVNTQVLIELNKEEIIRLLTTTIKNLGLKS